MTESKDDIIQSDNIVVLEDNMTNQIDNSVLLDKNTIILAAGDVYTEIDMDVLRKAFKDYGKSYQKLSEKTGISKEAIYKFLKGRSKSPSFYNVVMICKELGVSVDDLFGIHKKEVSSAEQKIAGMEEILKSMQKTLEAQTKAIAALTAELHSNYLSDSNNY